MSKIPFKKRFVISVFAIAWFLLFCLFLLSVPAVKAWTSWLIPLLAGLSLLIAAFVYGAYCYFRKTSWSFQAYFLSGLFFLFILTSLLGLPIYYLSYIVTSNPITVPQVVLKNGKRVVILQGMMHIGSEGFYKSVVFDLEKALTEGYHLYYEGISPGTPQSDRWFRDTISGGKDLSGSYRNLAQLCGLKFQLDYFPILAADEMSHPERHKVADISTQTMMMEFERLVKEDPSFAAGIERKNAVETSDSGIEQVEGFVRWQQSGTTSQKMVSGIVCRGVVTRALGKAKLEEDPMRKLILDFRNEKVADFISKDKADKIYVTYGADHIKGVVNLLKMKDSKWSVKSVKWSRVISAPDDLSGKWD